MKERTRGKQDSGEPEGGILTLREESPLPIRELDLKVAAAELALGVEETQRLVAGLDEARSVKQEVLDLEISI